MCPESELARLKKLLFKVAPGLCLYPISASDIMEAQKVKREATGRHGTRYCLFCVLRATRDTRKTICPIKHMQEKLSWHTEQRKVSDLIPNAENPRKMTEKQAEELKKSLQKFNLAEIPAINTDNKIVAGHMRVATLQLLGRSDEEIEVRVPGTARLRTRNTRNISCAPTRTGVTGTGTSSPIRLT